MEFGLKPLKALSPKKREFIKQYVMCGDVMKAYAASGHNPDQRSSKKMARNLVRQITPYLKEATEAYLQGTEMAIFGLSVVRQLAEEAESEQVRLNAAKELLSRNLPDRPQEIHVHKTSDQLSDEQVKQRIRQIQQEIYLEAKPINVVPISSAGSSVLGVK